MMHLIGYSGLVLNLASMAMKNVLYLRWLSLIANAIYLVYGILLSAPPFIIGCTIAMFIQAYHIFLLVSKTKNISQKS